MIAHKKALRLAKSQYIYINTNNEISQMSELTQQNRKNYTNYLHLQNQKIEMRPTTIAIKQNMEVAQKQGVDCIIDQNYYIIVYYGVIDPKEIVVSLLIDDGFPNREHKRAILNRRMNHIGIGVQEHPTQYFVIVIILANHVKIEEKGGSLSEAPLCDCQIV